MSRAPIDRSHLSIGEVLSLLQDEFPDVTISKIRFLESQGLLDPERTPSGYRKFYETDIERLRWILRQQKEHYLPLKVIKDRLDDFGPGFDDAGQGQGKEQGRGQPGHPSRGRRSGGSPVGDGRGYHPGSPDAEHHDHDTHESRSGGWSEDAPDGDHRPDGRPDRAGDPRGLGSGPRAAGRSGGPGGPGGERPAPASRSPGSMGSQRSPTSPAAVPPRSVPLASRPGGPRGRLPQGPDEVGDPAGPRPLRPAGLNGPGAERPRRTGPDGPARPPNGAPLAPVHPLGSGAAVEPAPGDGSHAVGFGARAGDPGLDAQAAAVSLTIGELAEASGMSVRDLEDLERFGLLDGHQVGDDTYYDGDALVVARTAGGFLQHGIEARHLRTYKVAMEREAGLFEQIVLPLLKQRNPEAHRRAARTIAELVHLGEVMRGVLLRRELRHHLGP